MKRRSNGRRVVNTRQLKALLSDRRILLCILAVVLIVVILIVSLSGRAKKKEYEEAQAALTTLQNSVSQLERENSSLQAELEEQTQMTENCRQDLDDTIRAMDLFWQIDESYVLSRYSRCRELIRILESEELAPALPSVSTTDNGRFSPYDRYAEICEALQEPYGAGIHS